MYFESNHMIIKMLFIQFGSTYIVNSNRTKSIDLQVPNSPVPSPQFLTNPPPPLTLIKPPSLSMNGTVQSVLEHS